MSGSHRPGEPGRSAPGSALAEALRARSARASRCSATAAIRRDWRSAGRRHRRPASCRIRSTATRLRVAAFGDRAGDQQLPAVAAARPISCRSPAGSASMPSSSRSRCPTGVRGTPPHVDLMALREGVAVAVTVRCIDYLSRRKSAVAAVLRPAARGDAGARAMAPAAEQLRAEAAEPSATSTSAALAKFAIGARPHLPATARHAALPVLGAARRRSVRRVRRHRAELAARRRRRRAAPGHASRPAASTTLWQDWCGRATRRAGCAPSSRAWRAAMAWPCRASAAMMAASGWRRASEGPMPETGGDLLRSPGGARPGRPRGVDCSTRCPGLLRHALDNAPALRRAARRRSSRTRSPSRGARARCRCCASPSSASCSRRSRRSAA